MNLRILHQKKGLARLATAKGFTMMEVLIAISLLTFGILSVYGAFSSIILSTYNISARFTAAYLAQEGVEVIRNIRDNNFINNQPWSTGLNASPCNTGCMAEYKTNTAAQLTAYDGSVLKINTDGFYSYDAGTNTAFQRKITISPVSGTTDAVNVDVLVTWTYNGKTSTFDVSEYLYNWY